MAVDRLFVVGASTGGVAALMRLVSSLPDEFVAPMLIVQHIGAHPSILPQLLANASGRDVAHASAGERIEPRKTRVAPPDCHMMVVDGTIRLTRGPKENCARPAIDPLFRSAALTHGTRVVGVVLTGQLDDGTVGLQEIKRHGGVAVVQDPRDALEPSMPASAIEYTDVDHVQAALTSTSNQAGWSALRALQERSMLLHQMAGLERGAGRASEARRLDSNAKHLERQIDVLSRLLEDGPEPVE